MINIIVQATAVGITVAVAVYLILEWLNGEYTPPDGPNRDD